MKTFISHNTGAPPCAPEQGRPVLEGWHVVQVRTSLEQKTCDAIRVSGWTAYCPMETKWRKPRGHETPVRLQKQLERRTAAIRGAQAITHADVRERALAAALRLPQVSSIFGKNAEVEVRRAFFPGYLFVAAEKGRSLAVILETQHQPGIEGVVSILQNRDGTYARVPHRVVDALMAAETQGALEMSRKGRRDVTAMFAKGQAVQVMGKYDGIVGEVVRCSPSGRIKIMLEKFGSIEVESALVEAVS